MRLQKYLASCGVASRRAAETLIADGKVTVNGKMAQIGDKIEPGECHVKVNGKLIRQEQFVYILLNKPGNAMTTLCDTHDRKTVRDCIKRVPERIFPVGRLDREVTGALIMTNDGELANRLTHPKYETPKVYFARVKGRMDNAAIMKLRRGIRLEDGPSAPAHAEIHKLLKDVTLVKLTIHEGRKHEVKRMLLAAGHPVLELRRISFAGIQPGGLKPGQWRNLAPYEVTRLAKRVGLKR